MSKLSKSLTTVTRLSRTLALLMFIIFPIVGFYLGRYYQANIPTNSQTLEGTGNWKTYINNKYVIKFPEDYSANYDDVRAGTSTLAKIDQKQVVIYNKDGDNLKKFIYIQVAISEDQSLSNFAQESYKENTTHFLVKKFSTLMSTTFNGSPAYEYSLMVSHLILVDGMV